MIKTITVKRKDPSTRLGKELAPDTVCKIGGALTQGGTPLKGITFEEERKYLPSVVGVPYEHMEFSTKVDRWYSNMSINIPFTGLKMVLNFDENSNPTNIKGWLHWKFLMAHPAVAPDRSSIYSNPNYRCFIEDDQEVSNKESENLDSKRKAFLEFSKVADDEHRLDITLRQLASHYFETIGKFTKMSTQDKQVALSKYMEKNYTVFNNIINDNDAELKAEIYSMIDYGILVKVGERIIYRTQPLGENIDEAVAFCKAAVNSETYAMLKGSLHSLGGSIKPRPVKQEEKKLKTVA